MSTAQTGPLTLLTSPFERLIYPVPPTRLESQYQYQLQGSTLHPPAPPHRTQRKRASILRASPWYECWRLLDGSLASKAKRRTFPNWQHLCGQGSPPSLMQFDSKDPRARPCMHACMHACTPQSNSPTQSGVDRHRASTYAHVRIYALACGSAHHANVRHSGVDRCTRAHVLLILPSSMRRAQDSELELEMSYSWKEAAW